MKGLKKELIFLPVVLLDGDTSLALCPSRLCGEIVL